jgi:hypothetical protein
LTAVSQNRETAAAEVLQARGRHFAVGWRDDQTFEIGRAGADPAPQAETQE